MKKLILPIIAFLASGAAGLAQTGSVITNEFIVNSGSVPILISGTTKAAGTLTLNAQPAAGDVITLGTSSYVYTGTLSGTTTNQIVISGSLAGTIADTIGCINSSGSNAGYYSTGTNASAIVAAGTGNAIVATAVTSGTAGNGVATTGSFASQNDYWGGATLAGGAVASGTDTLYTLPANGGGYVFSAAVGGCRSGRLTGGPR